MLTNCFTTGEGMRMSDPAGTDDTRNSEGPGPARVKRGMKQGIIWDFDDTLVNSTVYFEVAREKYAGFMVKLGFPLDGVLETLDLLDIENVRRCGGFLKECFPRAMVQTYEHFCRISGIRPDPGICRKVEAMGWWVFEQKPVPLPGAAAVLEHFRVDGRYEMFLATKGDPSVQWRRIKESGLKEYFSKIYVLMDKTRREYLMIARRHGLDPKRSWVIGNSLKSDINPGLTAGFNCIFIPNPYTWQFEMEEPLGEFVTLESLDIVPGTVLGGQGQPLNCLQNAAK